jgi:tetratricopeptide (TPR) repeat protein
MVRALIKTALVCVGFLISTVAGFAQGDLDELDTIAECVSSVSKVDNDRIITVCNQVLSERPNLTEKVVCKALRCRAVALSRSGRIKEGIKDFNDLCQLRPNDAEIRLDRAEALRLNNQMAAAFADAEEALRLAPDSANANARLAAYHSLLGSFPKALVSELSQKSAGFKPPNSCSFSGFRRIP